MNPVLSEVQYNGNGFSPMKIEILNAASFGDVIFDVGCKQAWWINSCRGVISQDKFDSLVTFGIDPINYNVADAFDVYINCAIGLENSEAEFYILNESGCNSLLRPSDTLLGTPIGGTNDIRELVDSVKVDQRRLDSILKEHDVASIYYLKSDCQGTDINVVSSLGEYLSQVQYVEMEVSLDSNLPFYDNQTFVDDVVSTMDDYGFDVIEFSQFPLSPLPEGECLFKRKAKIDG